MPTKKNMRMMDSRMVKFMHPREKVCVPIRVILHFRELCLVSTMIYTRIQPQSFLGSGEETLLERRLYLSLVKISLAVSETMLKGVNR